MDIRKVKKLIDLLQKSDINEIEIREGDQAVRISRTRDEQSAAAPTQVVVAPSAVAPPAPPAPPAAPAASGEPGGAGEAEAPADPNVVTVRSPMVGTFYAAATPGADPFVTEGATVSADDTLCIIEAMKTMNQIKAPADGVVVKVHAQNGDPVQYNQALADIKTA